MKPWWAAGSWLGLVLATGAFRFVSWVEGGSVPPGFVLLPVPELLLLWVWALYAEGGKGGRTAAFLVWLTGGFLVVWNLGEGFYRYFYRDHFDPATDLALVSGLFDMLFQTSFFRSGPGVALVFLLAAAGILAIGWLVEKGSRLVVATVPRNPWARGAGAVLFLAAAGGQYLGIPGDSPLTRAISTAQRSQEPLAASPAPAPPVPVPEAGAEAVPARNRPGLYLLVVESYGHTLFSQDAYRKALTPAYERLDLALAEGGWSARSGFLRSPTFGGRSWLADATLLTGIRIRNQEQYDQVAEAGEPNLTHQLGDRGYFRILAAPGTLQAGPAWKKTFAFDRYFFDGDFGYRGPAIGGLGRLSDQFLLRHLGEQARAAPGPVFAFGLLVSSHTPFERLPAYVDDWETLGDGSLYRSPGGILPLAGRAEGYLASIEYVFRCLGGFLARYPGPDDVVVIVGDHQPLIPVSETEATFSVPIHVLARNPDRLAGLAELDLDPGLVPRDRPLPHPGMEALPAVLLGMLGLHEDQKPVGQVPRPQQGVEGVAAHQVLGPGPGP